MNESDADRPLDAFAARLTVTAHRVALLHGARDAWMDLELDLWRALADVVKTWVKESCPVSGQPEAIDGEIRD